MTDENQAQQPRRSFLFDTSISMRRYVLRMGLISLLPSMAVGIALATTGVVNEQTGPGFEGPVLVVLAFIWVVGIFAIVAGGVQIFQAFQQRQA